MGLGAVSWLDLQLILRAGRSRGPKAKLVHNGILKLKAWRWQHQISPAVLLHELQGSVVLADTQQYWTGSAAAAQVV